MKLTMRSAALFGLLALLACSAGPSPEAAPSGEAAAQLQRWESAGLEDYRFEYQQQCFCVREQVQPVTIEVRDGRIARVLSKESGQDLLSDANLSWHTISSLFGVIADAQTNGTEPLAVRYHPQLGYPTHIEVGSLAADAGVIYSATNLEPL